MTVTLLWIVERQTLLHLILPPMQEGVLLTYPSLLHLSLPPM